MPATPSITIDAANVEPVVDSLAAAHDLILGVRALMGAVPPHASPVIVERPRLEQLLELANRALDAGVSGGLYPQPEPGPELGGDVELEAVLREHPTVRRVPGLVPAEPRAQHLARLRELTIASARRDRDGAVVDRETDLAAARELEVAGIVDVERMPNARAVVRFKRSPHRERRLDA